MTRSSALTCLVAALALSCGEDVDVDPGTSSGEPPGTDVGGQADADEPDTSGTDGCQTTLYEDDDQDGFGGASRCASADTGGLTVGGDCDDGDPNLHPGAAPVCGDWFDDDCDGVDEPCPTSRQTDVMVPPWDCTGAPPDNVLAYYDLGGGGTYFEAGGCFVFFEGLPGEFYVKPVGVDPTTPGRTCPSNTSATYDERMYAHTTVSDVCDPLLLIVHGPNENRQTVSTACRKFLFQMTSEADFSFVGLGEDSVRDRLSRFPRLELSCSEYSGWSSYYHTSLLEVGEPTFNPGFSPQ